MIDMTQQYLSDKEKKELISDIFWCAARILISGILVLAVIAAVKYGELK